MKSSSPSPFSAEIMKVCSKVAALLAASASASRLSRLTVSILLRSSTFGWRTSPSRESSASASSSMPLAGVDQQRHDIGVARPAPGGIDHRPVEPALRLEDAGRVDEDDLRAAVRPDHGDAAHDRARRLHLVADDGDLGADQPVDQRRLAGVGRADQRDEAAARRGRLGASLTASSTIRPRATARRWPRPAPPRAGCAPRRARRQLAHAHVDDEGRRVVGPGCARRSRRSACRGPRPAPIPAAPTWRCGRRPASPACVAPVGLDEALAPPRSRRRDRSPRSAPRRRRRAR